MTNDSNNSNAIDANVIGNYQLAWLVMNTLEMYYLPILVVIGSFGNLLSVYVVFASKMRRTSSSFYLAALALSDTGFLMFILLGWLGIVNIQLIHEQGFCQFFVYCPYVCSFLSAWFVGFYLFFFQQYFTIDKCFGYKKRKELLQEKFEFFFFNNSLAIYLKINLYKRKIDKLYNMNGILYILYILQQEINATFLIRL